MYFTNLKCFIAVAFVAIMVPPQLLECTKTCRVADQTDYVEGGCPVKLLGSVSESLDDQFYSECVTVSVWMKRDDLSKDPKVEIVSETTETIIPTMKKGKKGKKAYNVRKQYVRCDMGGMQSNNNTSVILLLQQSCTKAEANQVVSVSYSTTSMRCNTSYRVPDPIPHFNLSVNESSKSIAVTVEPGNKVYAMWCYQKSPQHCMSRGQAPRITIDPSQNPTALLNIPYLLPCVCVQVFYTNMDAHRHKKCLFQNQSIPDVTDVWSSSNVTLYESHFTWRSKCPASDFSVSASLCWKQQEHLCTPVLNSTLKGEVRGELLKYTTSAVDKHPQMCVQFSLQGSRHIYCPFKADMSSWEVSLRPGIQSVFLYFTSIVSIEARYKFYKFSAQLCVLDKRGCTPTGEVHSITVNGNTTDARLKVPLHSVAEKPCVQVWQSHPSLHGRRVLCPDYTHNRYGMCAVAVLIFVVIAALLGIFIHRLTKGGAAGWLCIQKPVLLVCSSEQSAHVSAVCALASVLQGELSATVNMALWALSSQTQAGAGTGVADLGPLPWLYGQWEAVRKAQGKVLIVWSPEAKKTYEKWREERVNMNKKQRKKEDYNIDQVGDEKTAVNGRRLGKCKNKNAARKKDCDKLCVDKDWYPQREPSTVIAPVFMAALACLEGVLQGCKGQGVALVYFQGLCHSRDIPKDFRGVPRYCLPQDFRGLIQELGGIRRTKTDQFSWHCWPRLLSKVLSIWLARQLAQRLKTLLPQTQGKKMQGQSGTSSLKMMSDQTQSRLKLPLSANMTRRPGTAQEHEPLRGSPWRVVKL
uniref:Interleukin 17 receptor E n=1 Tax=Larimichthys crocea TaxID=215358 RepID=A0A1L5J0Q9_LARCR|nr:interleukin 17 receptor E [Larimichthys crocea]